MFWETVNAIGVLKAPAIITIYDDGYGISVPNQFQMVKENIGTMLQRLSSAIPMRRLKNANTDTIITLSARGIILRSSKPM